MGVATAAIIGALAVGGMTYSAISSSQAAQNEPDAPEVTPAPTVDEAKEPVAKSVRNEEQRKLRNRRYLSGTMLTSPLGVNGQNNSGGLLGETYK